MFRYNSTANVLNQLRRQITWSLIDLAKRARKRLPIVLNLFQFRLAVRVLRPLSSIDGHTLTVISAAEPETIHLTNPAFESDNLVRLRSAALTIRQSPLVVFEPHQDVIGQRKRYFFQAFGDDRWRKFNHYHSLRSGVVVWNYKSFMLVNKVFSAPLIPSGIIINGNFPGNWYHWMVNILPKIQVLARTTSIPREVPLIMPEVARTKNFAEAVGVANRDQRPIIYLPDTPHLVQDAFIVDSPTAEVKAVRGPRNPNWSDLGDFHFDLMREWREVLLAAAKHHRPPIAPLIFLQRGDEMSRPYNNREVEETLVKRGYVSVNLEELPLLDQISLFHQAKIIVSTTGAQLVGLMWTRKAKCLTLVPPFLTGTSGYAKLASLGQSRIFEFHLETRAKNWSEYYRSSEPAVANLLALSATLDRLENC